GRPAHGPDDAGRAAGRRARAGHGERAAAGPAARAGDGPTAHPTGGDGRADHRGPAGAAQRKSVMRLLVAEYCCSRPAGESPRAGPLWREGWAMLAAAVEDARRIPGAEVRTLLMPELRDHPTVAAWQDVA